LVKRSLLTDSIYELWGTGVTYEELHSDVRKRTEHLWPSYKDPSFKFKVLGFQNRLNLKAQKAVIESFDYLDFQGPIEMKDPDYVFTVMENYVLNTRVPNMIYFGRWIADGGRDVIGTYDLKKRAYISTTSMDSELSLITANMALASPGKWFYDPFLGTGSFPVACAHFGAHTMGSDIDGRSAQGTPEKNIKTNFEQYGLKSLWLGNFISDLTNTPWRMSRCFDGIVCDPPYGVREGLRVLGRKNGLGKEAVYINGVPSHL
jgi:tRNA (guanine10-N2)-methyltransferase